MLVGVCSLDDVLFPDVDVRLLDDSLRGHEEGGGDTPVAHGLSSYRGPGCLFVCDDTVNRNGVVEVRRTATRAIGRGVPPR